jgi:uncharacterized membrane protein
VKTMVLVTTVGVGLVAGVFFAFSAFVTAGLDRAPADAATRAMRGINETAVTAPFMLAFLGTTLLCVALLVWGGLHFDEARARLAVAGGVLYVVGTFGTTMAANVPLNDRLARGDVAWSDYVGPWLAWNHVRAASAIAALVLLLLALERG